MSSTPPCSHSAVQRDRSTKRGADKSRGPSPAPPGPTLNHQPDQQPSNCRYSTRYGIRGPNSSQVVGVAALHLGSPAGHWKPARATSRCGPAVAAARLWLPRPVGVWLRRAAFDGPVRRRRPCRRRAPDRGRMCAVAGPRCPPGALASRRQRPRRRAPAVPANTPRGRVMRAASPTARCRHCRRPLWKHTSILRGYGRRCWAKVFVLGAVA